MITIGVDCATDEKSVGMALGALEQERPRILAVAVGGRGQSVAQIILDWLPGDQPALLALDAPLGWPQGLGDELARHEAGSALSSSPDQLFTRHTDHFVRREIGKRPLDVGADRIARTAYAALRLLQELRRESGNPVPLAWDAGRIEETSAIEVYPAATLLAHDISVPGYKKSRARAERRALIARLEPHLEIISGMDVLESSADALDAAVCVLAAQDFLTGKCLSPPDPARARKEGWIWVRAPQD